jgi:glycerol-3-phosphate dehydrogenase
VFTWWWTGSFLGGDTALIVPKTADGRVLFAVPWLGKVILGTTDTPRKDLSREPLPFGHEIDFILSESARYLRLAPKRSDVKSVWVGLASSGEAAAAYRSQNQIHQSRAHHSDQPAGW